MPPPRDLDFWHFDLEVGVGVACDLGYPCAKFRLPRPFGFRVRAVVRDIRRTDGRTDDGRRWPPNAPPPTGRGHNNLILDENICLLMQRRWRICRNLGHCVSWPTISFCHWLLRLSAINHQPSAQVFTVTNNTERELLTSAFKISNKKLSYR